jgi:hypothetical protein
MGKVMMWDEDRYRQGKCVGVRASSPYRMNGVNAVNGMNVVNTPRVASIMHAVNAMTIRHRSWRVT